MAERWFKVCKQTELKDGSARSITILGKPYAVFSVSGELFGLDAACRHMRANLASGSLQGTVVTCFMHQWQYDITNGRCLTQEGYDTISRDVKIEDGYIYISVDWPESI
ncbi:Rieske 2Fe-2S domain-containing protein [bacterium]|nr:Rieske 2Fe-2S domain-containing protein [bacterium]